MPYRIITEKIISIKEDKTYDYKFGNLFCQRYKYLFGGFILLIHSDKSKSIINLNDYHQVWIEKIDDIEKKQQEIKKQEEDLVENLKKEVKEKIILDDEIIINAQKDLNERNIEITKMIYENNETLRPSKSEKIILGEKSIINEQEKFNYNAEKLNEDQKSLQKLYNNHEESISRSENLEDKLGMLNFTEYSDFNSHDVHTNERIIGDVELKDGFLSYVKVDSYGRHSNISCKLEDIKSLKITYYDENNNEFLNTYLYYQEYGFTKKYDLIYSMHNLNQYDSKYLKNKL